MRRLDWSAIACPDAWNGCDSCTTYTHMILGRYMRYARYIRYTSDRMRLSSRAALTSSRTLHALRTLHTLHERPDAVLLSSHTHLIAYPPPSPTPPRIWQVAQLDAKFATVPDLWIAGQESLIRYTRYTCYTRHARSASNVRYARYMRYMRCIHLLVFLWIAGHDSLLCYSYSNVTYVTPTLHTRCIRSWDRIRSCAARSSPPPPASSVRRAVTGVTGVTTSSVRRNLARPPQHSWHTHTWHA